MLLLGRDGDGTCIHDGIPGNCPTRVTMQREVTGAEKSVIFRLDLNKEEMSQSEHDLIVFSLTEIVYVSI